jgi:broad-specificity NMP kinase
MRDAPAAIVVVTGPSGVGKSTVSRLVATTLGEKSVHIRMDDFWARATSRSVGERPDDPATFADLHARFDHLGEHERNVVEATGTPDDVAAAVRATFHAGGLVASLRDDSC